MVTWVAKKEKVGTVLVWRRKEVEARRWWPFEETVRPSALRGTVVTWGDKSSGGDSSAVRSQLKQVVAIFSACGAFAALSE